METVYKVVIVRDGRIGLPETERFPDIESADKRRRELMEGDASTQAWIEVARDRT